MANRGDERRPPGHRGAGKGGRRGTTGGGRSRAPSQRQLRVGEELRHRLALLFERATLNDPALDGLSVTVTEVKVSPDLTNATAFVTPLGGGAIDAVVKTLNHAAGYLRHLLAGELDLRVSPRLSFAADRSFEAASRIESILRHPKVAGDIAAPGDEAEDETDAPPAEPEDDDGST